MSHMGSYAVNLSGKVDLTFLEAALKAASEEVLGIEVQMQKDFNVTAMNGTHKQCKFGFRGGRLNYGIGIAVENNQVKFFGDSYGVESDWQRIQDKTTQVYTALALAKIARDRGLKIENLKSTAKDLILLNMQMD